MIRAITYTVLFCGASAGAALALALVHDTRSLDTGMRNALAKPALPDISSSAATPDYVTTHISVPSETSSVEPTLAKPTPAVAREVEKARKEPAHTSVKPYRSAPSPKAVVSTRNNSVNDFDGPAEEIEIARNVPVFVPRKPKRPRDISTTWSTGVYR